jgi:hypothetical protein
MIDLSNQPVKEPAEKDRVKVGWSSAGPIYADEMAERSRISTARLALMEIADALGDVDAFIQQYDDKARKVPKIAAQIVRRLLVAGRTEEAWQTISATEHRRRTNSWEWPDLNGKMPASTSSKRLDVRMMPKPRGGNVLSTLSPPTISAHI